MGTETYSGYAALVAGWGDLIIIEKVPKPLILGPIFKAIGGWDLDDHLKSITYLLCDSGLLRPKLLRLAYLGLPATKGGCQFLLCCHGLG
jgi:hypothetical protein